MFYNIFNKINYSLEAYNYGVFRKLRTRENPSNFLHLFCCLSLLNFVYPLYFFVKKTIKNSYGVFHKLHQNQSDQVFPEFPEKICAGLTVLMILFGELFWINPIQFGFFHRIDGFIVKISFCYQVNYLFFRKSLNIQNKIKLYTSFFVLLISFYFSNYFSSKEWCSKYHIFFHIITHISSSYGISFAYQ